MARNPIGITLEFSHLPAVTSALRAAALKNVEDRRDEALNVIHAYEHVITGRMVRETEGTVAVMRNDVATTAIISQAPYSADEELGTRFRPGHHRIEQGAAAYQAAFVVRSASDLGRAVEGAAR